MINPDTPKRKPVKEIYSLSLSKRKLIASLRQVKNRRNEKLFTVEGTKSVLEMIGKFNCRMIAATQQWICTHGDSVDGTEIYESSRTDMERMTSLSTPSEVIGVFSIPEKEFNADQLRDKLVIALDGLQDPGNLGTIIRACDWFGVREIICSKDTVDQYNPKVVQSTMGALGRVNVHYTDLPETLGSLSGMPIYGTFLDGEDIYSSELSPCGIVIMGNEGKGISGNVARAVSHRLYIPSFSGSSDHVESLNVSMAAAVTLSEFRRRNH